MKFLDPDTESAVRTFLARLPAELRLQYAILYGSRARGEDRPDSDADLALILRASGRPTSTGHDTILSIDTDLSESFGEPKMIMLRTTT